MLPDYAELHCHSAYSLLDGASLPEALVARGAALGLRALALTDHDDLGGVVRFSQAAAEREDGPAALCGAELTLAPADGLPATHLTLIARTAEGYRNLSRLVSLARQEGPRGRPGAPRAALATHAAGLLCLSGCPRGEIPWRLRQGDLLGARRAAGWLRDVFGSEHFALEVQDHGLPEEAALAGALIELAARLESPWVVTNNVHYALPEQRRTHDLLTCLRYGTALPEAGRRLRPNAEWHLKGKAAMAARWRHDLRGLRASVALAETCTLRHAQLKPALPAPPLPPPFTCPDVWLAELTWRGATTRWGPPGPQHTAQIRRELDLIAKRGLAGYFLIMYEIVQQARSLEILVQGRGSAANSAVCYCLGITAVDPIRHQLLFERFLSEAREGYPDIDLDIAHARREELIQWVYARYGRDHAAMVCEHICFRGRSALRDAARALGLDVEAAGRLATRLDARHALPAEDAGGVLSPDDLTAVGLDPEDPRSAALLPAARALEGLPRHRSIHVGGFVLSAQPIAEIVPIEAAAMPGRSIIQWDKDDLEAAGLPKFDLLGLGMLTALDEALRRAGGDTPLPLYALPDDPAVYEQIGQGDTVGVFQIESRAQMNCLPRTRPATLYELAIQVALIRPGPLQGDMVHPYIRRKRGEEPVVHIHPDAEPILGRTLGIPLFQEQGMQLAVHLAGFTPVEADGLRRAMGSQRHRHRLAPLLDRLQAGLTARGIPEDIGARIATQLQAFSTYGFPESHSTSFAWLVYASAWLKHHHPAAFLCALLNAQPMGFYRPASLIHDARRHGVCVRPPCLLKSGWDSDLEPDGAVRLGLRLVKGLARAARPLIEAVRRAEPSTDAPADAPMDLATARRRYPLPRAAWIQLARAGALDALIHPRRRALWAVMAAQDPSGTLPLPLPESPPPPLPAQTPWEQTTADQQTLGLTTGPHPFHHLRPTLARLGATPARQLPTCRPGAWLKVAGQVLIRQRPPAAKGFCFITLEDETGHINLIIRPQDFEANRPLLLSAPALWAEGLLHAEHGVFNLKARRFQAVPGPNARRVR